MSWLLRSWLQTSWLWGLGYWHLGAWVLGFSHFLCSRGTSRVRFQGDIRRIQGGKQRVLGLVQTCSSSGPARPKVNSSKGISNWSWRGTWCQAQVHVWFRSGSGQLIVTKLDHDQHSESAKPIQKLFSYFGWCDLGPRLGNFRRSRRQTKQR